MRRLARHLFTLCLVVSMLLCVVICALWVRSGRVRDEALIVRGRQTMYAASDTGTVLLSCITHDRWVPGSDQRWTDSEPTGDESFPLGRTLFPRHAFAGEWTKFEGAGTAGIRRYVFVPYWFVALLAAAIPAWSLGRRMRVGMRAHNGLCPACGYDLRGSPERCSECGTVDSPLNTRARPASKAESEAV